MVKSSFRFDGTTYTAVRVIGPTPAFTAPKLQKRDPPVFEQVPNGLPFRTGPLKVPTNCAPAGVSAARKRAEMLLGPLFVKLRLNAAVLPAETVFGCETAFPVAPAGFAARVAEVNAPAE